MCVAVPTTARKSQLTFCFCRSTLQTCAMISPNWPVTCISFSDASREFSLLPLSCALVIANLYCAPRTASSALLPPLMFGAGMNAWTPEVIGDDATLRSASLDRKSTRLNSSHSGESRMPSSA